jgi:CBS domain-containing protein/osmotically-inducible protein OsmY
MKCKDLMTRNPEACVYTDTAARVGQMMKSEDVGPIPIVAGRGDKHLIGIVTDRDLALKVVAEGRDPNSVRVEEIMSRDVVSCRPEDDVERALHSMTERKVRRIPIVDQNGKLVGIISQADAARKLDEEETGEVVREISEPSRSAIGRTLTKVTGATGKGGIGVLIGGLSLGLGAMYLLDPNRGRHRRALVRDKTVGFFSDAAGVAKRARRDAANRMSGIAAEARTHHQHEQVSDDKLINRIRSKMGREVSHPHSIHVSANGGRVTLRGPILESDADRLVHYVSKIPGVVSVDNQLELKHSGAGIPGLQGEGVRTGARMDLLHKKWAPATRVAASAIGGGLMLYGLTAPYRWSKATAALGLGLLTRGITR